MAAIKPMRDGQTRGRTRHRATAISPERPTAMRHGSGTSPLTHGAQQQRDQRGMSGRTSMKGGRRQQDNQIIGSRRMIAATQSNRCLACCEAPLVSCRTGTAALADIQPQHVAASTATRRHYWTSVATSNRNAGAQDAPPAQVPNHPFAQRGVSAGGSVGIFAEPRALRAFCGSLSALTSAKLFATRQQDRRRPGRTSACTGGVSFSAPWTRSCSAARPPRRSPGRWTGCAQPAPS